MSEAQTIDQAAAVFERPDDRTLIKREAHADSRFAKKVGAMLREPDGERKVAEFAKAAVLNEFDPQLFPETVGYWNLLRKSIRKVTDELPRAISATVSRMTPEQFASAKAAAKAGKVPGFDPRMLGEMGDLGQFEIIGSIVGSLVQAGANVYGSYLQNRTQQQLAQMQFDAQQAQLNAQMNMARAQQAIQNAQTQQAQEAQSSILPAAIQAPVQAIASALTADVGGIPIWLIGLGLLFVLKFGKWE